MSPWLIETVFVTECYYNITWLVKRQLVIYKIVYECWLCVKHNVLSQSLRNRLYYWCLLMCEALSKPSYLAKTNFKIWRCIIQMSTQSILWFFRLFSWFLHFIVYGVLQKCLPNFQVLPNPMLLDFSWKVNFIVSYLHTNQQRHLH